MKNLERLRSAMAEHQIEALLIADADGYTWATGFTGSAGWVILTADTGIFLTDSRYTLQAQEEVQGLPVDSFATPVTAIEFIGAHLSKLGVRRLGIDAAKVSHRTFLDWSKAWEGVQLELAPDLVSKLRMVKSSDEIEKVRQACKLADACLEHIKRLVQPGVSEWDIGMEIEFFFRRQGATSSFDPVVVSGLRSARPHGRASEKKLESGDFLTLDLGARLNGYCSDITRTFVVDEASPRHREIYNQVLKAQVASIEAIKPGVRCVDIDKMSREILDEIGLAKYFGHGLGHGLGRLVHDSGRLGTSSTDIVEEGQIWTVEPGVYIEGFGGVRIEDDVVVKKDGVEVLTHFPKELTVLPEGTP
ncbi:MAG: aminopeptidase P family protein [Fimbriimonadaceae bacterium]|nr:aminopeptidase P family protein [Fimbriimonadaceae bacterium]